MSSFFVISSEEESDEEGEESAVLSVEDGGEKVRDHVGCHSKVSAELVDVDFCSEEFYDVLCVGYGSRDCEDVSVVDDVDLVCSWACDHVAH